MPHQTRTPSTQLSLCKDLFNQLVGILDFNIKMNIEDEKGDKMLHQFSRTIKE